jgi:hypothetical protein
LPIITKSAKSYLQSSDFPVADFLIKKICKVFRQVADNHNRTSKQPVKPITEGRRVIAKYERQYQAVNPIGQVNSIAYYTPKDHEEKRRKRKGKSFEGILKKQLKDQVLEENQTFQLYC